MISEHTFWQRVYRIRSFTAKGFPYFIKYGRWRLKRRLRSVNTTPKAGGNSALFKGLNSGMPGLKEIQNQYRRGEIKTAELNLIAHYRHRSTPSFFFDNQDVTQIVEQIETNEKTNTIHAAEEINRGIYRFRGADPVDFSAGIDWLHRPMGNIDWALDLNRHNIFVTLGKAFHYTEDEKYAQKFCDLAQDWMRQNPQDTTQTNWSRILQVAMRLTNWTWAFFLFLNSKSLSSEFLVTFLNGINAHGQYLYDLIEYHAENNHLLVEAKVLAMVGFLFPEIRAAANWHQRGQKLLYQEIVKQVCPDGVHGERAALYQRLVAGEILEYLLLMDNNAVQIPASIMDLFSQMVEFELWSTKQDGEMPLWGDSSLTDTGIRYDAASCGVHFLNRDDLSPYIPPVNEAGAWLLGTEQLKNPKNDERAIMSLNSRAFMEGGYFISRDGSGLASQFLMFDCGPFGYPPLPSHGHADALSFELAANGQTVLVDPGVYSTRLGAKWRNFFRGSQAHNTVVVDEQDQSTLVDIWRVHRPAQTTLNQWLTDDFLDFVDGSHNGYERLANPITHRRQILFVKPDYWVVVDHLEGQGVHTFDFLYHIHPAFSVECTGNKSIIRATNSLQPQLLLLNHSSYNFASRILRGEKEPIQGWYSDYSGAKTSSPVIRFRIKAQAPLRFCTVLLPVKSEEDLQISISPLLIRAENLTNQQLDRVAGFKITKDKNIDYLVVHMDTPQAQIKFDGVETDAQIFFARFDRQLATYTKIHTRHGRELLIEGQSVHERTGRTGVNHDLIYWAGA